MIPQPEPLGYFITWTTYGTWLPGDERGWAKRRKGLQQPDPRKVAEARERMVEAACRLGPTQRRLVVQTITDHCARRRWTLHAVACRTNHVHVVVTSQDNPSKVREQLKAWCSRRLSELDGARSGDPVAFPKARKNWWTERGSKRYLNDEESLEAAIVYVQEFQDRPRKQ